MNNLVNLTKKNYVVIILAGVFVLYFYYMSQKNNSGSEKMSKNGNAAYKNGGNGNNNGSRNGGAVQPSESLGQNSTYSAVGAQPQTVGLPSSCNNGGANNPSDLLPKDTNSQWAQLNPAGKGDLSNINLLKAGAIMGIDTKGQSMKNANLSIRSEPPNPQMNTGIWNQSTITPDFMRPPLEIGQGSQ
jgi:hypothetical protein